MGTLSPHVALAPTIVAGLAPQGIDIDVFILLGVSQLGFDLLPAASTLGIVLQRPLLWSFYLMYSRGLKSSGNIRRAQTDGFLSDVFVVLQAVQMLHGLIHHRFRKDIDQECP